MATPKTPQTPAPARLDTPVSESVLRGVRRARGNAKKPAGQFQSSI